MASRCVRRETQAMKNRRRLARKLSVIFKAGTAAVMALSVAFALNACGKGGGQVNTIEVTSKTSVQMVLIPAGGVMIGSKNGSKDEAPRHQVHISAFVMDKYEVMQKEYAALEIPDPSQFKDPNRPVEQIRWSDAALFCNQRSIAEGLEPCYDETTFKCNFQASGYRLPTEAEWEYAARAGSDEDHGGVPTDKTRSYACYAGNSKKKTNPVGSRKANAWGLHDLQGNVLEWCHDVYSATYYQESPAKDPHGPAEGKKRVMRGGAWKSDEAGCRITTRYAEIPGITDACFARNTFGFRCVRRISADELKRLYPKQDQSAPSAQ